MTIDWDKVKFRETWIPIPGFEGKYEVSDLGRIKSLNYRGNTKTHKILKPSVTGRYLKVDLVNSNFNTITRRIHVLVMRAFRGPSNGLVIDHIDGDGFNNALLNLRYTTSRNNISCENVKRKKPKASKFTGVSYNQNSNGKKKWRSIIKINKVTFNLGTFATEEEARDAYQKKLKTIL